MTHAMPAHAEAGEDAFAIGKTVLIARGLLTGLRGTVSGFTTNDRCILTITGANAGVKVVIGTDALKPMDTSDTVRRSPR